MNIILGVLLAAITVLLTVRFRALKFSAAMFAGILITVISYCGGISAVLILICAYFSVVLLEHALKDAAAPLKDVNEKQGARDFVQVFANGIAAVFAIVLFKWTENEIFFLTYIIGVAEALADSVASDVGVLSGTVPRDICRFKKVPVGMSGGVTPLGFLASFICCCAMAIPVGLLLKIGIKAFLILLLAPFFGCVLDSVFGSMVQAKYQCTVCRKYTEKRSHCGKETIRIGGFSIIDNCRVNLISNCATCVIASLILAACG